MTIEPIHLEMNANGVAVLTINRPAAMNALTLAMMKTFADNIARLSQMQTVRAVIVTGATGEDGRGVFCAGGDLIELSRHPTEADAQAMISTMGDALLALERLPVPTIAAINGYALGGGAEIALACDMRIADAEAQMAFVQLRWALIPGWGAGQRLLRAVGYAKALELLISQQRLTPPELLALGLINERVEAGAALKRALTVGQRIAVHDADAVRAIKALLQAGLHQPYADALQFERELFPRLWAAHPHLDAVAEFVNKRT